MALTDESNGTGMVMPVQPMGGGYGGYGYPMAYPVMPYGNGGFGNGFDGLGGDWIVLFLFAMMFGGWGNGFGGGFGGWGGGFGNMFEFPWLLNGQNGINNNVNDGFRTAQLSDSVTSVRDAVSGLSTQLCQCCGDTQMALANGFANVNTNVSNGFAGVNLGIANGTAAIQNSLCNGFNGVNQSVNNAQNAIAQQMYTNQISDLERSFAAQTANTAGLTNLSAQLAQCCCDNRSATQDLKYVVATENCADRTQAMQNTRDIIDAQTRSTQAVLDKLCQLELDNYKNQVDAKNDQIAQLRQEVLYARGQASQVDQTARILAGQAAEIDGVYNRLKNCPVNTVPVYGNQPIFTCPQSSNSFGCGCGSL